MIPSLRARARAAVVVVAAVLVSGPAAAASALPGGPGAPSARTAAASTLPAVRSATGEDPNLDQTLGELAIVHGERVLEAGHLDMGPKYDDDGVWRFLIHDDVAKADAGATSVWRYPDETVLHVRDEGKLVVPDDAAYAFVGADPGSEVWVAPQTQDPDVVWIGWNTQDPTVMQTVDRGVTLSLRAVEGPGTMTTYLQSGSFGAPQVLWDSRVAEAQPVWVDVNTHTHANWVFTAPGVYLVELTAEADLIDGSHVSDTQRLRLAVGTATSPDEAFAATWAGGGDAESAAPMDAETAAPSSEPPLVPILVTAIVVVAAGIVGGAIAVSVRSARAKRVALGRGASGADADAGVRS
ncbi:surface-anchored protein [Microbacterium sp. SORGH_AS 1204]|uniref:choice-of-anchor M domain-containing protein n=1 Tax=Microbacterium sp. SORGH_AS_1204 TaxID=3041785 RepID=UPI0027939D53|nr:choice-of-anchor M domain-containing protein [Microbacterium sp. SORGH_AS_1204]MDQ1136395.1 surface-anchored protein [Microbacterium sp. SORGH_AS_1204]